MSLSLSLSLSHWQFKSSLLRLEYLDNLVVYREGLVEALEGGNKIPKGTECQFLRFDGDGDVVLKIGCDSTVIFYNDFVYLDMI